MFFFLKTFCFQESFFQMFFAVDFFQRFFRVGGFLFVKGSVTKQRVPKGFFDKGFFFFSIFLKVFFFFGESFLFEGFL